MRALVAGFALVCAALVVASGPNFAQDKKDEKPSVLKGTITCAKCDLKLQKACATVIVVKGETDKKDLVIFFDKDSNKKYHGDTCSDPKKGSVEGVVADEGKKKVVTVKKLTYE